MATSPLVQNQISCNVSAKQYVQLPTKETLLLLGKSFAFSPTFSRHPIVACKSGGLKSSSKKATLTSIVGKLNLQEGILCPFCASFRNVFPDVSTCIRIAIRIAPQRCASFASYDMVLLHLLRFTLIATALGHIQKSSCRKQSEIESDVDRQIF